MSMHTVDPAYEQGIHVSRDLLYHRLLQCSTKKELAAGRKVHFFIVNKGLDTIAVFVNHLLRFYVACGSLAEANQVFETSRPNLFSYNAIMSAHAKLGDGDKTLELFDRLQADMLMPDICTFLSVLNACGKLGAARQGREVHSQIIQEGLDLQVTMSNTVIDMYAKCASLDEGRRVFDRLSVRDAVTWAAMIAGYSQHGHDCVVLELFEEMRSCDLRPNDVIFSCILKASGRLRSISIGRFVHKEIITNGLETLDVVVSALVDMYAKCENLEDAQRVFDWIGSLNVVVWNAIIMGYAQHGGDGSALILFKDLLKKGIKPDKVTYLGVLRSCGFEQNFKQGRLLHHALVHGGLVPDLTLRNSLMNMYAKCGSMQDAQVIFDSLPCPDVLSWGTIIDGYAEQEYGLLALDAFELMQQRGVKPNDITFVSSLKACIHNDYTDYGRKLHDEIVKESMESRILVGSMITNMYAKFGSLEEASNCFERLGEPDVVAWGAIISGFIQMGCGDAGLDLFAEMLQEGVQPSEGIFLTVLQACVNMDSLETGSLLHEYIVKHEIQTNGPVGTILVQMYASFGELKDAQAVFDSHSSKDVVTWGAMIAGYVQHGHHVSAIELFIEMYTKNVKPNRVIFLCILKSCSSIGSVIHGRMVHKEIIENGLESDVTVGNTLVDMYTKCGSADCAHEVLNKLSRRDVVTWSALLGGHSRHGDSRLSMKCLETLKQDGLRPDDAVFTIILAACSHEGSLEKGLVCFEEMAKDHDVMPGFQHYYSVVDLLGRAGLFREAEDVLSSMPNSENITGWTSLLSGCKTYGNVHVGQKCYDSITELAPNDASSFMLMSSIYKDTILW